MAGTPARPPGERAATLPLPWVVARPRWLAGVVAGVATHVLFGFTVWHLFRFLSGEPSVPSDGPRLLPGEAAARLAGNAVAALAFALPHSALLHPTTRTWLRGLISPAFYGLFFCVATCLSLLAVIFTWQPSPQLLCEFTGLGRTVVRGAFYASWVALFYSLALTGLGWQTGLTPWLAWVRQQPQPRREFRVHGAYRWLRHPIYLSFLGLIWFNPRLTADRAILLVVWTAYIFVGSWLKDLRLARFVGEPYRDYQRAVPGYPFIPWGPLGRLPGEHPPASPSAGTGPRSRVA